MLTIFFSPFPFVSQNAQSSRSHACMILVVEKRKRLTAEDITSSNLEGPKEGFVPVVYLFLCLSFLPLLAFAIVADSLLDCICQCDHWQADTGGFGWF